MDYYSIINRNELLITFNNMDESQKQYVTNYSIHTEVFGNEAL